MQRPRPGEGPAAVGQAPGSATGPTAGPSTVDINSSGRVISITIDLDWATSYNQTVSGYFEGLVEQERSAGGNLGRPSGPRARSYERLARLAKERSQTLFPDTELELALDDMYRRPLKEGAYDTLRRQLKAGVRDDDLAELVKILRSESKLVQDEEEAARHEPQIICSLGLA